MITWVTVWVLTVSNFGGGSAKYAYQLQYATQATCEKQRKSHDSSARCDFQQIPVVVK